MKILFLDIDGVLNSRRSCVAFKGYPHDTDQEGMEKFDLVALGLIRRLCEETGCKVVISSAWRLGREYGQFAHDLELPVIGKTPNFNYSSSRGHEIADWLSRHEVEGYAIVDDDSDMLPEQMPFFVQTSHVDGLLWDQYARLKHLLEHSTPAPHSGQSKAGPKVL